MHGDTLLWIIFSCFVANWLLNGFKKRYCDNLPAGKGFVKQSNLIYPPFSRYSLVLDWKSSIAESPFHRFLCRAHVSKSEDRRCVVDIVRTSRGQPNSKICYIFGLSYHKELTNIKPYNIADWLDTGVLIQFIVF